MNQHQLEVALLDQKHRQRIRILSFSGAAVVAIAVLWGSGASLTGWFKSPAPAPKKPVLTAETPIPTATPIDAPPTSRETPASALAGTDASVSKVPLALLLVSTNPGQNNRDGTAAIGVARANPQIYVAGALLANGARLREIYKDYVVLERDGRTVRLYKDAKKNSQSELVMIGGPQTRSTPAVVASSEPLTDYLRPNAVYDGEMLRGYEVYPGEKSGAFSRLGLQGGDVITSLNNVPFSDPAEAIERFRQLTNGAAMVATVERNGELKTVTLDGSILVAEQARAANPAQPPIGMTPP